MGSGRGRWIRRVLDARWLMASNGAERSRGRRSEGARSDGAPVRLETRGGGGFCAERGGGISESFPEPMACSPAASAWVWPWRRIDDSAGGERGVVERCNEVKRLALASVVRSGECADSTLERLHVRVFSST
jgi:hypothetical protein